MLVLRDRKNPPGDIPDDQVFVVYASAAGGYRVKVPEGWKRTEQGPDVEFIDKLAYLLTRITPAHFPRRTAIGSLQASFCSLGSAESTWAFIS
jgi:hypothetical protein